MIDRIERRLTLAAGALCLGGIVLFVCLAAGALLAFDEPGSAGDGALFDAYVFDAYVWRVARFTLLQASLSTILSILLAIPVARALARQPAFPGRVWIIRLMALPLGLPALVAALGLIGIWGRQGVLNTALVAIGLDQPVSIYGLSGILVAHVFFNMPLAARLMLGGLERIPGEYWLVGANLGMRPVSIFRFIEWPSIRGLLPGIAGLIFMLCATSFTLVLTLGGGPAASTIEVAIYQALRFDFDPPRAIALSLLQISVTSALLIAIRLLTPVADEGHGGGRTVRRFDGRDGFGRVGDWLVIALAVLFLALPLGSVVASGLRSDLVRLASDPVVQRALVTSVVIALVSGLLCVLSAALMIRARQAAFSPRRPLAIHRGLAAGISASSSLVLLVPPVVLGAGWFLLLRPLGDVARFAPLLVILINMLMALPFVYRVLEPAMATHTARTSRLAVSLGLGGWHRLRLIDWPGLCKPLLMALSFACALSLGDLGAVALFGSQDMVTLPWLLYSRMAGYRSTDAAGLALFLGLVCLVLTIAGTPRAGADGQRRKDVTA
ncbi:thiamine/thiamine pyrophosphate ABC transporter permease ThiP [Pararhizobium sp. YC-54]|uniref:thiamine/thiamine pyrophosphate ABC transporter permease ThiP n=1 Tax=Pararhizobium sp. YC-54 TaxID=2986920 RepID=UPI0021F73AB5|nr:thiamine/thiamine pyrophosphate ABC transporter permease ThiP [Pararhizobium sp. YC-54]MCV9997961.1 thiamine/thiamine pyrophosphate ABC transporter permease ThiP [Pararhizobium sp. YC-54]